MALLPQPVRKSITCHPSLVYLLAIVKELCTLNIRYTITEIRVPIIQMLQLPGSVVQGVTLRVEGSGVCNFAEALGTAHLVISKYTSAFAIRADRLWAWVKSVEEFCAFLGGSIYSAEMLVCIIALWSVRIS